LAEEKIEDLVRATEYYIVAKSVELFSPRLLES